MGDIKYLKNPKYNKEKNTREIFLYDNEERTLFIFNNIFCHFISLFVYIVRIFKVVFLAKINYLLEGSSLGQME